MHQLEFEHILSFFMCFRPKTGSFLRLVKKIDWARSDVRPHQTCLVRENHQNIQFWSTLENVVEKVFQI